jgi:hypothetical protein
MASTWEEALEMASLAQKSNVPLVIHENWRWQPWFREAQRLMQAGSIGKPVSYCFRARQRDGLGDSAYARQPYFREMPRLLIYETVVHHIDTARFLFGPIDSLYARVRRHNPKIRGEDCVLVVLRHLGEVDGVIDGHRFIPSRPSGPGRSLMMATKPACASTRAAKFFRGQEMVFKPPAELGYKGDSVRDSAAFHRLPAPGRRRGGEAQAYLRPLPRSGGLSQRGRAPRTSGGVPVSAERPLSRVPEDLLAGRRGRGQSKIFPISVSGSRQIGADRQPPGATCARTSVTWCGIRLTAIRCSGTLPLRQSIRAHRARRGVASTMADPGICAGMM